ncbi:multidrug ABC transporter permease [bacterium]|nr:multidrug ABC transporter permease [bacterium]
MEKIKKELKIVYILWLRQIKRHFRFKLRLFLSIFQPLLFLVSFGFGFQNMYSQAGNGNYIDFLAPGIIAMSVVFSAMFSGIEVITDRQFGFLKETLVAPISRLSIILGRTIGGATIAVFQGVLILFVTMFLGFTPVSLWGVFMGIVFMLLIALLFTAFGTTVATFFNDTQAFPIIINLVIMPMFFLSGALFPLEGLPKLFSNILNLNPLAYGVDGLRGSLVNSYHYSFSFDFFLVLILVLIVLFLGSYRFSKIED